MTKHNTADRRNNYIYTWLLRIAAGAGCGLLCGSACVLFAWMTSVSDRTFHTHEKLLFLLPAAGLLTVLLYDRFRAKDELSMDALFLHLHEGRRVSPWIVPLIAVSTCTAYLTGGSVGRVGSALQIGGGLAVAVGAFVQKKVLPEHDNAVNHAGALEGSSEMDSSGAAREQARAYAGAPENSSGTDSSGAARNENEQGKFADGAPENSSGTDSSGAARDENEQGKFADGALENAPGSELPALLLSCGMASGFCAILNAPLAGALFGAEVLVLRGKQLWCLIPSTIASFITWSIAKLANVPYFNFHEHLSGAIVHQGSTSDQEAVSSLVRTGISIDVLIKVIIIGFAAVFAGWLYLKARAFAAKGFALIKNPYLRVLAGTALVIIITILIGDTNCNGIGFSYVDRVLDGHSAMLAFVGKIILTALTLGCGIRGGEIAPMIFIGATSGFAAGCIIGLDPMLAAALGIAGTLASVTNCQISIGVYILESICFNGEMLLYTAIVMIISYLFSGTWGLYSEQHPKNKKFAFRKRKKDQCDG